MSESLLRAILRLFAVVAHEDEVSRPEREQIKSFLEDHMSGAAVEAYLRIFDEICASLPPRPKLWEEEVERLKQLCQEVSPNLTQKQKAVILVELVTIIQADGRISDRENQLVRTIGEMFMVNNAAIEVIEKFVLGKVEPDLDDARILLIHASDSELRNSPVIQKTALKGFIAVLYLDFVDLYFFRYMGTSSVFLNGVPVKP